MKLLGILLLLLSGCAAETGGGENAVMIVPGVGGPSGYDDLAAAVDRPDRTVQVIGWGAPAPLFFMNFNDATIHEAAERDLAGRIRSWHLAHPTGRIDLIGHSAGCGVVLGALPRVGMNDVHTVLLLAPSVSPKYDLNPALSRISGMIHVFISDRDITFLKLRTSTFGTYDGVRSPAAGNSGFAGKYPPARFRQYEYQPRWEELGYDGGHFSIRSGQFAQIVIAPLLEP